jgi:hypothetical protein
MPRCAGFKANGEQCSHIVAVPQQYCYAHSPEHKEQRRAAASKAAKSRSGSELCQVRSMLRRLADDVLDGSVDRADGSVAAQILGVYLRAVELERKVKESEEFEARLAALEELASMATRRYAR